MNRQEKSELLKLLLEELASSKVSIFAEFSGLSVKNMEELRKELKKHNARMMVLKNTLAKIALQSFSLNEAADSMVGPNMLIWSRSGDESEIIKQVLKFSKDSGKIKIRFGIVNEAFTGLEAIEIIGSLPSKKNLQAMVIGGILAPVSGLIYNIKYPLTRLILVLKTFSEKKEK